MVKAWDDFAWEDYLYWQTQDKKTLKRINLLFQDTDRNGYSGISCLAISCYDLYKKVAKSRMPKRNSLVHADFCSV